MALISPYDALRPARAHSLRQRKTVRTSSTEPSPKLGRPDMRGDVLRAWEVLSDGGNAIPEWLGRSRQVGPLRLERAIHG
jgi:hypothetical protein